MGTSFVIVLILDGMDQAKFAWPRHEQVNHSKQFDSVARPRLHVVGVIVHGYFRCLFVTDSDVKKDSNLSIELQSFVLTKLRSEGVDVNRAILNIQADNTCRENKNNHTLKWCGFLVATGRVQEVVQSYLPTGHTHEDIDQWFGRVARHLLHEKTLQTPDDYVSSLNIFLQRAGCTTERWSYCYKLDQVRDWVSWLNNVPVQLVGIGGPGAPHEFRLCRRGPFEGTLSPPSYWRDVVPHDQDVVLALKKRMADSDLMVPAFLYLPWASVLPLVHSGGPNRMTARNPIDLKLNDELTKFAAAVRAPPFCLNRCADYMDAWLAGLVVQLPPLDTSYCAGLCVAVPVGLEVRALVDDAQHLDPSPNTLRLACPAGHRHLAEDPASDWAKFVYPMAIHLWSVLGGAWEDSLSRAKLMWDEGGRAIVASGANHDEALEDGDEAPAAAELEGL